MTLHAAEKENDVCAACNAIELNDASARPRIGLKRFSAPNKAHESRLVMTYRCNVCGASWVFDLEDGAPDVGWKATSG